MAFELCAWTYEEGWNYGCWQSSCGEAWVFEEGGPAENRMNYCPFCGKGLIEQGDRIQPKPYEPEVDA